MEIVLSIVYLALMVVLIGRSHDGRGHIPNFKPDTRGDATEGGPNELPARESAPPGERAA